MDLIEKIFTDKKERKQVNAAFNKSDPVEALNKYALMQGTKLRARLAERIESLSTGKYIKEGAWTKHKAISKLIDDLFIEIFDIEDLVKECNALEAEAMKMIFDEEKAADILKVTTRLDEKATKVLARKKSFERIYSRLLLLSAKVEVDIKNNMN